MQQMKRQTLDRRKLGSWLLNGAFFAAVFLAVSAFQSRNMLATDRVAAPALQGMTLEGERALVQDLRGQCRQPGPPASMEKRRRDRDRRGRARLARCGGSA